MYTGYQIYQAERPKSAREQREIDMGNAKLAAAVARFGPPAGQAGASPAPDLAAGAGTPGPLPRDRPVAAGGRQARGGATQWRCSCVEATFVHFPWRIWHGLAQVGCAGPVRMSARIAPR